MPGAQRSTTSSCASSATAPRPGSRLVEHPGPNLLQGAYAPRSNATALARPWRLAAGLVLAAVALALVGKGTVVYKLARDEDRLLAEIGTVCSQSYSSSQLNACRLEMMRRLDAAGQSASGSNAGFLATQAVIAEAGGGVIQMESMNYADGTLFLNFLAPGTQYVADFSAAIAESGRFQVVDPNTSNAADGTLVTLRVVPVRQ